MPAEAPHARAPRAARSSVASRPCLLALVVGGSIQDYYDNAQHYDVLWGKDNIHTGTIRTSRRGSRSLSMCRRRRWRRPAPARPATSLHIPVLDLGCGKGLTCKLIAELTGAACTGLDLSEGNIARANELAAAHPESRLDFHVGSFTDVPASLHGRFTHVIAQEALVYAHAELPRALDELKKVLRPGGVALVNDFLGADGPVSAETRKAVHDRLGFDVLLGHVAWRRTVDASGLELRYYENIDAHMAHAYSQLAEAAARHDFKSADGTPLADNYRATSRAASAAEVGKNIAVLALR